MVTFNEEKQNKRLGELKRREEEALAEVLSKKYGIGYMDLTLTAINTDALRLIPEATAREMEVAIVNQVGKKLTLAVRSPNQPQINDVSSNLKDRGYSTTLVMVSRQSLERAWEMYKDLSFAVESRQGVIEVSGEEMKKLLEELQSLDDVKNLIDDVLNTKKTHRISRVLEVILAGALFVNSSDVHIEPEEEDVRVRYRLDGVLTNIINFDRETYRLILSRIKLVSGLKLNVKNNAQDGRFSINIENANMEVRTSVLPDAYGESIVMRLLDPKNIKVQLDTLGFEKRLLDIITAELKKPNGMILTTGPTGAGKTTTLYAFLKTVHNPEIKIITIEDPIEYHLPGIVQTQVDKDKYTFNNGLRSALRQDPDVIMVGEIRDEEVAETAVHSALTGHLVFSTLHTNNAAGSFARLIDLGINPKVLGSAINMIMAQRLVRVLCEHCKKKTTMTPEQKKIVDPILTSIMIKDNIPENTTTLWEPVGCTSCNHLGYKGRIGIYEAILMDEAIENLVTENPSEREVAKVASKQGIMTMRQDGMVKALRGITSLSELERIISLSDRDKNPEPEVPKKDEQVVL